MRRLQLFNVLFLASITITKTLERHNDITYGSFGAYLSSSEIQEYLETYEETRENVDSVRVFSYGKSLKNVSLWGICIGEMCNSSNVSHPQALFTSLIHSREPMALMALICFMDRLESRFREDSIETLLKSRTIWILPLLNPDGYDMNQATHPNGGGFQRKNARENCEHGTTSLDQIGIDLNRNFPVCFDHDEIGSSSRACAEDYQGSEAFSEPETAALRDWMLSSDVDVSIALNFHSFGRVLNLPNMCRDEGKTRDEEFFQEFANDVLQNNWDAGHPYDDGLYSVNGALSDWMYHEHHIMAMSPEMGPSLTTHLSDEDAFWPNRDLVLPMALEAQKMILEATWRAGALYKIELSTDGSDLRLSNMGLRKSSGHVRIFFASSFDSKEHALEKLRATYDTCSDVGDMDSRSEHTLPVNISTNSYLAVAASDDLICVTYIISEITKIEEYSREIAGSILIKDCDDAVLNDDSTSSQGRKWDSVIILLFIFMSLCAIVFVGNRTSFFRRRGTVMYKPVKETEEITIELEGV